MSINLTGKEIHDLALFAGFDVKECDDSDMMETEFTVCACPEKGLYDDDGENPEFYSTIAYYSEYPEEGCIGLGEEQRCKVCGYTKGDAQIHMDHHLCENKNPPWEN